MTDTKLDNSFLHYKELISTTSEKSYNDVKERLVSLYFNISSNICDKNVDGCIETKELFTNFKYDCNIGRSFIKNMIKKCSLKLKKWYEIYRGK